VKRIDRIIGSGILALGLIHTLVGLIPGELDTRAMWFIGTGLAVIYQGALNLLRVQYGAVAAGLRRVSVAANVVGMGFAVGMVLIRGARALGPTTFLFLALLAAATMLSIAQPRWHQLPRRIQA